MLTDAKSESGTDPALENSAPFPRCAVMPEQSGEKTRPVLSWQTDCCIVGGGPAGAVLGLVLARKGVSVTLLEAHKDFDREFRGNTINPSVMEVMEDLDIVDRLLGLRHAKITRFTVRSADGTVVFADFRRMKTRYPYMLMLPQARFLELITAEARKYPNFRLAMGARVKELIEEDGAIRRVRYRGPDGPSEVRARLTVGADGRFSRTRRLGSLLLTDIEVESFTRKHLLKQCSQLFGRVLVGVPPPVSPHHYVRLQPRPYLPQCSRP